MCQGGGAWKLPPAYCGGFAKPGCEATRLVAAPTPIPAKSGRAYVGAKTWCREDAK